jgi:RHS repeat-associated protein
VVATPISLSAPDLIVSAATAPETGVARGKVDVSWTVKNQGTVSAPTDWYDYVYLSTDNIFGDGNDYSVISQFISAQTPLAADGSYTINSSVTLPNVAPGNYYLLFEADGNYGNYQGETDETNNVYAVAITVTAPDLVVSAATAPTNGIANGAITVSYTVTNQGNVASSTNWYDQVYLSTNATFDNSDTYISQQYISSPTSLGAGESYTKDLNLTLPNRPAGNYYLLFLADVDNRQYETDETNNNRAVPITIGVPDLSISEATAPTSRGLGESVTLSWKVTNSGLVTAPADWTDRVYFSLDDVWDSSDTIVASQSITTQTPLIAGNNYSISKSFTLPNKTNAIGSGYLLFVTDAATTQAETSETNNVQAVAFTLDAPNLAVTGATASSSVAVGETINVTWDVTNQGTVAANADWYDSVYISDDATFDSSDQFLSYRWSGSNTPLAAGASYTGSLNVTLPTTATGDRYLLFVADNYNYYYYNNNQGETNENDNVYAVPINISAADLTIDSATAPSKVIAGETVELSWTVTNQGTGQAAQDWSDRVYLSTNNTLDGSDTLLSSESIAAQTPLAAGSSYSITKNIALSTNTIGQRYLIFTADGSGNQGETNESNNTKVVAINFVAPDLVVSDATVPTMGNLGSSVAVSWTVTNQSTTDAPSAWSDYVYLSNDNVLDGSDTLVASESISSQTPLVAGNSYTINRNINLTGNTAIGSRYLLFVADGSQNQGETDNNNNVRAVSITLNAADLVVSNITAPVEIISGQSLEIAWTDKNQGTGAATGTWYDDIYLENQDGGQNHYLGNFEFTGTLPAGASIDRSQSINLPIQLEGNYRVVVTTDYHGQIPESSQYESNNTTVGNSLQVKLAPIPNLQVSSVTAPLTAFSSQSTEIQWTVKNVGNGATSSPYWSDVVYLSLDNTFDNTDIYLGQANNPSYLNAGDSYTNHLDVTLPLGISGNYYFLVQTDIHNNVFENDKENDNLTVGGPTNVSLTPPPDFQVTTVTTPSQVFSGQSLTLSWTVTNKGLGKNLETVWYDQVFLSTDEVLDAGDRNLGTFSQNGILNSNDSYTSSQTVSLPIGISGNYYFFVRTDAGNQVYENIFESNNTGHKATPTRINLTPPPDLEIASLTAPTQATASRALNFSYQVTNFGSTTTPNYSWADRFYLSLDNQLDPNTDLYIGNQSHYGSLAPDESYSSNFSYTLPNTLAGNYYLFGITDSNNEVFELDNGNNTFLVATPIAITSQPADLIVVSASAPTTGEAGKALRVEWTVRNQGTGDTAVSGWTDRVILSKDAQVGNSDDIVLGSFSRGEILAPNQSYTRSELVTIPFDAIAGYQVFVVTDVGNSVYEATQENNNSSTGQPLTVTRETADLQVTQVSSPSSGQSGQALTVNWTVKNFGSRTTNGNYWYDSVYLSTDNQISNDDIFLGNNYRSEALDASEQYSVSRSFNLPNNLQAGNYYTLVRTDALSYVYEGSLENNNDKATQGTTAGTEGVTTGGTNLGITASPDLVMVSVDAPITGIGGQNLTVSWTVRNAGTVETGDRSWYEAFYLSRDQVFDRNSDTYLGYRYYTGNLAAGATYSQTESFRLPQGISGPFYLFAETDAGNWLYEGTAENNNVIYDPNSVGVSLAQPADLVVGTITIPANGVTGQNASITYTVKNEGSNAVVGNWSDSLYLSKDGQWDINDLFLGQAENSGEVLSDNSYTNTVTASLPGVVSGDYQVIIRSDIRNQIPESNESNNLKATLDQVNVDVARLTLGTPSTGSLAQGQGVYYRFDVGAGETLRLKLDSVSTTAANELYLRYGEVPTRSAFDLGFSEALSPDQEIVIPATRGGTYYVLAYGGNVPTVANYTLEADLLDFSISALGTSKGSNKGQTTVKISGAKFTTDDVVSLIATDGTQRQASKVWWKDSTELWATFDLQGLTTGAYDVRVNNTAKTAVLNDSFTVTSGAVGHLETQLDLPSALRPGQAGMATIHYANTGETDLISPLLTLSAEGGLFYESGDYRDSTIQLLAINSEGAAGILSPGATGSFSIRFLAENSSVANVNFTLNSLATDENIDWNSIKESSRPEGIAADVWDKIYSNFVTSIGGKASEFQKVLGDNANRLSQLGEYTTDISRLLSFELQQVNGNAISARSTVGAFGRGGVNPWDVSAITDAAGNVAIQTGDRRRTFTKGTDGTYQGITDDLGILTKVGEAYQIKEFDGTVQSFLTNGKLDFIQDTNGNKVTLGYTNNRLTGLSYSNGDNVTFKYNAQGRVNEVIDIYGQSTTYTYDATGERLLSVSDVSGTVSYTYETVGAKANAIKSITYPDGTQSLFEYDDLGRITKESLNGGEQTLNYSYDSTGGVTVTDANNKSSQVLLNDRGQVAQTKDALGRVSRFSYDSDGNLTQVLAPDGSNANFTYDSKGNLLASSDALGRTVKFAYDSRYDQLASVKDQNGNAINYTYDDKGNLGSIGYADGSKESFTYSDKGDVTVSSNRREQQISYTYDSRGLLTKKEFADGTSAAFEYDLRGNLTKATDADSSVTYNYDVADRLTKVSYGPTRFLSFSYDAGGRRSQMVDQDGFATNYSYDSVGRLKQLTDKDGQNIVSYSYNALGQLTREDNGNSTYTTYSYDDAGQALSIVNYKPDNSINSRSDYTYNQLGQRTSLTTLEGKTSYGYDAIGQLIAVDLPNGRSIEYKYDAAGNRITVKDSGATTSYSTNNLNQYTTVGGDVYSYDKDGNLTSKTVGGQTSTFSYDIENRLIGVTNPDGTWQYQYDALGNRIGSTLNGQKTEYLLDPTGLGDVVGEYTGSQAIRYSHGLGLVSRNDGSNTSFFDTDAIGSVVGLSGTGGNYLNSYSYLPFGESLTKTETVANSFEYVGQFGVMNEANGLDFMRARFYTPGEGRFISADPIGVKGGVNLYLYTQNAPVSFIDVNGKSIIKPLNALRKSATKLIKTAKSVRTEASATNEAIEAVKKTNSLLNQTDTLKTPHEDIIEELENLKKLKGGGYKFTKGFANAESLVGAGVVAGAAAFTFRSWAEKEQGANEWTILGADVADTIINPLSAGKDLIDLYDDIGGEIYSDPTNPFNPNNPNSPFNPNNPNSPFNPNNPNSPLNPNKPNTPNTPNTPDNKNPVFKPKPDAQGKVPANVVPRDPNDIIGPTGFGEEKWTSASSTLPYTIRFENISTATAPAQTVTVTHPLDTDLDLRTFRLSSFGWGGLIFDVPANTAFYNQRLDLTATRGYFVDVTAGIDLVKGEAFWTVTTIDPNTGDVPVDPLTGFLPPNNTDGIGDGFVNYTIKAKRDVLTGTVIDAKATIVFDTQAPIDTPPIFNTLDAGKPTSTVKALPTNVTNPEFVVNWTGNDGNNGSALANYTIYVSDNNGEFTPWLTDTTLTEATYIGQTGHTYAFYSIAKDNAGNTQTLPDTAQATIIVGTLNTAPTIISGLTANFAENGTGIAYTVAATDAEGTTPTYGLLNSDVDASLFNINSTTGAITFKTAPDFETPLDSGADNTYNLTVTANDGSLTSSKAVAITVTDLNEIQGNSSVNNGRNPIVGTAGPDYLTGGAGAKTLTGGGGNDSFVFTNMRDVGQRIADFTVGQDKLVFTQLFSSLGYKGSNPITDGYIKFVQGTGVNSAHTFLQIDRDGLIGSAIARNFLQVDNITPTQLNNINNFQF